MRTVQSLIEELQKFPPDAVVSPYEGEVIGVGIESAEGKQRGFIHCHWPNYLDEPPTEVFKGA